MSQTDKQSWRDAPMAPPLNLTEKEVQLIEKNRELQKQAEEKNFNDKYNVFHADLSAEVVAIVAKVDALKTELKTKHDAFQKRIDAISNGNTNRKRYLGDLFIMKYETNVVVILQHLLDDIDHRG